MAENAPRDENFVPTTLFQIDGEARGQLMAGQIDEATGRILVDASSGGSGDVVGPASATDNAVARYDSTTGKIIQNSGVTIDDSDNIAGVANISAASATLSGLTASEIVITDGSKNLASAAVATYPSLTELSYVKGVTSAIQTQIDALSGAIVLKGTWDASSGSFPGGGSAQAGWSYIVSTGGTVDGIEFAQNDRIVAITDNASTTTYAANWFKLDYTDQVLSVFGRTGAVSAADGDYSQSLITGLKTSDSPQFAGINVGAATDTTLTRVSAGLIAVEGDTVGLLTATQTMTNKTLTSPTLTAPITDWTIEPATDDSYEGEATDDILAGDTIAQWDLVYLDTTSGRWENADASAVGTAGGVLLGLALEAGTDGNAMNVLLRGIARNDGWTWTGAGYELYVSETANAMTETAPTTTDSVTRVVGYALSDDAIMFNPSNDWATYV